MPEGYWNGEPAEVWQVQIIVGDNPRVPVPWYRHLIGQRREAVEVRYAGHTFYLDNEDGQGWWKVTKGKGSPQWGSRSLYPETVIGYVMGVVGPISALGGGQ